jgi:hypothetical protein
MERMRLGSMSRILRLARFQQLVTFSGSDRSLRLLILRTFIGVAGKKPTPRQQELAAFVWEGAVLVYGAASTRRNSGASSSRFGYCDVELKLTPSGKELAGSRIIRCLSLV